jgi:predicted unusual protein kinase regulating ubiquinone biosynthesis (AarF/ABC1/UbiB family)
MSDDQGSSDDAARRRGSGGSPLRRLGRAVRLGAAAARTGAGLLAGSLLSALGSERGAARSLGAAAASAAGTLGSMKGLAMKVGQYLSFAVPDLPPELAEPLSALQASAPPRPFAEIAAVAEGSLGRPLAQAFTRFERTPLAAASIGQVHRAWLEGGAAVAVKVQYPDVAAALRADVANASALAGLVRLLVPGLDAGAVAGELRARILEELDYRAEADCQRAFGFRFAGHPFAEIPEVIATHSTGRVLTTRFADGVGFAEARRAAPEVRDRLGEILFRFLLECVLEWGTFIADPHPGNYRFGPGGARVAFLDFGCVKVLPAPARLAVRELMRAALLEPGATRRAAERLGVIRPESGAHGDAAAAAMAFAYAPFRDDAPGPFPAVLGAPALRAAAGLGLREVGLGLSIPGDLPFLNRTVVGLYAVLTRLGARASWRRIALEHLDAAPPSTPLGEAEARWREARGERGTRA